MVGGFPTGLPVHGEFSLRCARLKHVGDMKHGTCIELGVKILEIRTRCFDDKIVMTGVDIRSNTTDVNTEIEL